MSPHDKINKVVLAYSGGLDTSIILKWLRETYDCEVVTFTADLGQGEELEPARKKAEMMGVKEIYIDDLRQAADIVYCRADTFQITTVQYNGRVPFGGWG